MGGGGGGGGGGGKGLWGLSEVYIMNVPIAISVLCTHFNHKSWLSDIGTRGLEFVDHCPISKVNIFL